MSENDAWSKIKHDGGYDARSEGKHNAEYGARSKDHIKINKPSQAKSDPKLAINIYFIG